MYTSVEFNQCPKYSDFTYWFVPNSTEEFTVYQNYLEKATITIDDDGQIVGIDKSTSDLDETTVVSDFLKYKGRPEYQISCMYHVYGGNQEEFVTQYETLIVGCALIRAFMNKHNPDNAFESIEKRVDWLRQTDFYNAPGSTIYHDSEIGGLLKHSLRVVYNIQDLCKIEKFHNISIDKAVLVALCHDWCKIGLYSTYKKNVKNENGQWEQVDAFKRNPSAIPLGHGVESLYKTMKIFRLSDEECLAIRWHMGRWNVCDGEINEFQSANERYPLVLMLQFADQLAITEY